MNKYCIINGSPRTTGTSTLLSNEMTAYFNKKEVTVLSLNVNEILNNHLHLNSIAQCSTLIFIGPCYVNNYPGNVIEMMELFYENKEQFKNLSIYGIIQGGMPYLHTHEPGLRTLSLFAEAMNFTYRGGFIFGLGPIVNGISLDNLPNSNKIKNAMKEVIEHIEHDMNISPYVSQQACIKIPLIFMYLLPIYMNHKLRKDFKLHKIDYHLRPYSRRK